MYEIIKKQLDTFVKAEVVSELGDITEVEQNILSITEDSYNSALDCWIFYLHNSIYDNSKRIEQINDSIAELNQIFD